MLRAPNILLMSFLWDMRCDQAMTMIKKSKSGAGGYRMYYKGCERGAVSGVIISSPVIALLIVSIFSARGYTELVSRASSCDG